MITAEEARNNTVKTDGRVAKELKFLQYYIKIATENGHTFTKYLFRPETYHECKKILEESGYTLTESFSDKFARWITITPFYHVTVSWEKK